MEQICAIGVLTGVRYEYSQNPAQTTDDEACEVIPQFVSVEV